MQLGEVPAGAAVEELAFQAADEGARPVAAGLTGKVMCGWMRRARTAVFEDAGSLVLLPPLPVTSEVLCCALLSSSCCMLSPCWFDAWLCSYRSTCMPQLFKMLYLIVLGVFPFHFLFGCKENIAAHHQRGDAPLLVLAD